MLLEGIIFDKDGTIFGFDETWIHWCKEIIEVISSGDRNLKKAIENEDGKKLEQIFTKTKKIRQDIIEAGQDVKKPDFGRK